ncbi:hypothetical protein EBQ90_04435 [bacterium]|nr:hypothetical protein [bacterium]
MAKLLLYWVHIERVWGSGPLAEGNLKLPIVIQILILVFSSSGFSAIHRPEKMPQKSPLFFENARQLVTKTENQKPEDNLYQTYFGGIDNRIALLYRDQWGHQEQSLPFRGSSWRGEFISNSVNSGTTTYDWEERQRFARQVFRMRIDQGVREYLKNMKQSETLAKAQGAIESLQNVSITSSEEGGSKAQLRLGYDLFSDSSKLEYVGGVIDFGFYKNRMLANPTDGSSALMTMTKDLGDSIGRASVTVPLNAEHIQTSLSKQLSSTVATSLSSTQPLKTRQDSSYYWNVAFSF